MVGQRAVAEADATDLIVIASHARSGVGRMVLGASRSGSSTVARQQMRPSPHRRIISTTLAAKDVDLTQTFLLGSSTIRAVTRPNIPLGASACERVWQ